MVNSMNLLPTCVETRESGGRSVEQDQSNDKVISGSSPGIKRSFMRASWTHCGLSSSGEKGMAFSA